MSVRKLNDQQIAHVLASLRYCQDHTCIQGMEHFVVQDGSDMQPLMDDEINELCEDINCGYINYVGVKDGVE